VAFDDRNRGGYLRTGGLEMPLGDVLADSMVNLGKATNRRQILGSQLQHVLEFLSCIQQPAHLYQGSAQRDMSGQIRGMSDETGSAGLNRFLEPFGATILLGERGKGNGRRVRLDPAFQFFDARRVRHD
jgi:hypothetical protein